MAGRRCCHHRVPELWHAVEKGASSVSDHTRSDEELIDNAATASQHRPLLNNPVLRKAVQRNCCKPLRDRIGVLEDEIQRLREVNASTYQREQLYRTTLQEIRDATPANKHEVWPHHHWYLAKASEAVNHSFNSGDTK